MNRNLITMMFGLLVTAVLGMAGCGGGGTTTPSTTTPTTLSTTSPTTSAQKRSVVIFPNTSTLYYADSAPDGTGIVARRDPSGKMSSMDVIDTDGTYYQLTWGSTGLPSITLDGYLLTAISKDASGNATQIKVTEPNGTSTTFTNIIPLAKALNKTSYMTGGGNPECGSASVDSPDFPRAYGCNVALEARDPTWQVINSVLNWASDLPNTAPAYLANRFPRITAVAVKAKNLVSRVINEMTQISSDASNYTGADSDKTTLGYSTDTNNPSGSSESTARNLIADAKKLGNNEYETQLSAIKPFQYVKFTQNGPELINSPTVTCTSPQVLQNGVCVTPVKTCTAPQVLQNGVCVKPTVTCTSPQVLQNGVCVSPTTPATGCISPNVLFYGICVDPKTACTPPSVVVNGHCSTVSTWCNYPQVLQNGACVYPDPVCTKPNEIPAYGQCAVTNTTYCQLPEVYLNGCVNPNLTGVRANGTLACYTGTAVSVDWANCDAVDNAALKCGLNQMSAQGQCISIYPNTTPSDLCERTYNGVCVTTTPPYTTPPTTPPYTPPPSTPPDGGTGGTLITCCIGNFCSKLLCKLM